MFGFCGEFPFCDSGIGLSYQNPLVRAWVGVVHSSLPEGATEGALAVEAAIAVPDGDVLMPDVFVVRDGKPAYEGDGDYELLAAPSLVTILGQPATISIGSEGTDYMESVPGQDGVYRAAHTDEGPSLAFACVIEEDADDWLTVKFDVKKTVLERRDPIEGLNLDVGRPVLSTTGVSSTLKVKLGWWIVQPVRMAHEADEWMVIVVRLMAHDPEMPLKNETK